MLLVLRTTPSSLVLYTIVCMLVLCFFSWVIFLSQRSPWCLLYLGVDVEWNYCFLQSSGFFSDGDTVLFADPTYWVVFSPSLSESDRIAAHLLPAFLVLFKIISMNLRTFACIEICDLLISLYMFWTHHSPNRPMFWSFGLTYWLRVQRRHHPFSVNVTRRLGHLPQFFLTMCLVY